MWGVKSNFVYSFPKISLLNSAAQNFNMSGAVTYAPPSAPPFIGIE